jgi:hypothetical protein
MYSIQGVTSKLVKISSLLGNIIEADEKRQNDPFKEKFAELDNKVYTLRLSHISDPNSIEGIITCRR